MNGNKIMSRTTPEIPHRLVTGSFDPFFSIDLVPENSIINPDMVKRIPMPEGNSPGPGWPSGNSGKVPLAKKIPNPINIKTRPIILSL